MTRRAPRAIPGADRAPRPRTFIADHTALMTEVLIRHRRADPRSRPCRAAITLDGVTYACTRADHSGAHDADARHTDGGLVRW